MATKTPEAVGYDPVAGRLLDKDGNPLPRRSVRQGRSVSREEFVLDTRSVFDKQTQDAVVTRDADGYRVDTAGKKSLPIKPREVYRRGTFWRVVAENIRVEAMCNYGKGANGQDIWSGWSRVLPIGTVVECIGWRRFRRDGLVAPQFIYPGLPAEAKWSTIWPNDGVWRPWPMEGILVAATQDDFLNRQPEPEVIL